jgi:hypothetical protein
MLWAYAAWSSLYGVGRHGVDMPVLDDSNKPNVSKNEKPGNCHNIERNCSDGPVKENLTFFLLLVLLNRYTYIRMGLKKKLKNPSVASLKKYVFLLYSRIILSTYSLVNNENREQIVFYISDQSGVIMLALDPLP